MRKIATITLQNNGGANVTLTGQDILQNKKITGVYQNTNAKLSIGTAYVDDFELTIVDKNNTAIFDKVPNNSIQRDKNSSSYFILQFDNISLDKSFVRFLQRNTDFIQLLFEYEE